MKNKSILVILILGIIFALLVLIYNKIDNSYKSNEQEINTNNEDTSIEVDKCSLNPSSINFSEYNLDSSCDEFIISVNELSFVFKKELDDTYNLDISFNDINIYSSKTKNNIIYSDEQAGLTKIVKVDEIYLVSSTAAMQCGDGGIMIVVSSSGSLIGIYDVIDLEIDKENKVISYYEDKDNTCGNLLSGSLEEVTYYVKGNNLVKSN